MLIRKISILFIISFFCGVIALYIISNNSPLDLQKIQTIINNQEIEEGTPEVLDKEINNVLESSNLFNYLSSSAYVVLGLVLISVFCSFVAIHLTVEKLFFKKFFENPNQFDAIRRGILICLVLTFALVMKLLKFDFQTILIGPLVGFLIEIIFILFKK